MNTTAIIQAAQSHAMTLGRFSAVNGHEPKSAPASSVTCAIWVQSINPAVEYSGLASTSARVELSVRVYSNMLQEPQDAIDPDVSAAVDDLMSAYSGDFTLGGDVAYVDLLGSVGAPLSAIAGYLSIGSTMFRVMTITLPLVVADAYTQIP